MLRIKILGWYNFYIHYVVPKYKVFKDFTNFEVQKIDTILKIVTLLHEAIHEFKVKHRNYEWRKVMQISV